MNEYILGADDALAGPANAQRKVIVLEHADVEALVEHADLVEKRAPEHDAEHRQHLDIEAPARAGGRIALREPVHAFQSVVIDFNPGFVSGPVGHGPDEADLGILEMTKQRG